MDFCVINFVIFVCVATKFVLTLPTPTIPESSTSVARSTRLFETTTETRLYIVETGKDLETISRVNRSTTTETPLAVVEMGKGLETIPRGSRNIKSANLAYNHLMSLPDFAFSNKSYKSLSQIELQQNQIINISVTAFRGLKQLKTVDLSYNKFTTIDLHTFRTNNRLEKLDLTGNRINFERGKVFLRSNSLEILILSNNKIEQLYEFTFSGVPNLKTLMLDSNVIFMVHSRCFTPLNNLRFLSLANTGVYRLSIDMFETHPKIIDISGTPLAHKFNPPLKKVKDEAVGSLIRLDEHIFVSDFV